VPIEGHADLKECVPGCFVSWLGQI